LIEVACQVARSLQPKMQVFGDDYPTPDGTCIRDYVHVTDIAAAHILALKYLIDGGESVTLNCGYGRGHSVMEVLSEFEAATGQPISWETIPRRPGDAPTVVARTERIRDLLGWKPKYDDLRTILTTALDWDRQKGTLASPAPAQG
jgi:UDP-glucose 4-epimerase